MLGVLVEEFVKRELRRVGFAPLSPREEEEGHEGVEGGEYVEEDEDEVEGGDEIESRGTDGTKSDLEGAEDEFLDEKRG